MSGLKKIRLDGETIDPKKCYSGARVIELLNASYSNGYNRAKRELDRAFADNYRNGYCNGHRDGYSEASEDLAQLKKLLSKLLGLDSAVEVERGEE